MRKVLCSLCTSLLILGMLSATSCRIKVPTVAEQQALMESGAFPGSVPAWIYRAPGSAAHNIEAANAGYLPDSFVSPRVVSESRGSLAESEDRAFQPISLVRYRENKKGAQASTSEIVVNSPIDRILKACPSVDETSVTDALMTEDIRVRSQKYLSLISRCSVSADLWIWLGRDYQAQSKAVEAGRCFDKALVLDSSNTEAKQLLSEVRGSVKSSE